MTLKYQTPFGYKPTVPPSLLRSAVTPLRLIFWGSLLLIFDLTYSTTTNGQGYRLDLLDDTVGMILICIGVFRLAKIRVSSRYAGIMTYVKVVSIIKLIDSIDTHFIYDRPSVVSFLQTLLGMASLVAIILFCRAMRTLALHFAMVTVARSWQTTRLLFIIIYVLPLGFLYLAALASMFGGSSFHIDLGPGIFLVLAVFAIPPIHFFISTSRFKRAIQASGAEGESPASL